MNADADVTLSFAAGITGPYPSPPATWYLLWCRVCTPEPRAGNTQPFSDPAERGRWASEHTRGTGHESWLVEDVPRWTVQP